MTRTVTCKFCTSPVTVEIYDGALQFFTIERWLSMAACNRCADYRERRRALIGAMLKILRPLDAAVEVGRGIKEAREKCRDGAATCARKFCEHVCRHHGRETETDQNLIESLLDLPHRATEMLFAYERSIRSCHEPTLV